MSELDELKHDIAEYVKVSSEMASEIVAQQAEIDRLKLQRDRLVKALGDLSFECFGGGFGTCQPSVKTYNETFADLDEIRKGIS